MQLCEKKLIDEAKTARELKKIAKEKEREARAKELRARRLFSLHRDER
jgi:hypothetical protein